MTMAATEEMWWWRWRQRGKRQLIVMKTMTMDTTIINILIYILLECFWKGVAIVGTRGFRVDVIPRHFYESTFASLCWKCPLRHRRDGAGPFLAEILRGLSGRILGGEDIRGFRLFSDCCHRNSGPNDRPRIDRSQSKLISWLRRKWCFQNCLD